MTAKFEILYVDAPDADLDWLRATVKQYDWYVKGEAERVRKGVGNRRALAVLTTARDRYARIAKRMEPSAYTEPATR